MGFLEGLLEVVNIIKDGYSITQAYPSLQDAMNHYITDGYTTTAFTPFTATVWKQGAFGDKTVSFQVLENGSVSVEESGALGRSYIFPIRIGAPTPQQYLQLLQSQSGTSGSQQNRTGDVPPDSGGHQSKQPPPHVQDGADLKKAYEVLGISTESSAVEIRKAYHSKLTEYHPDKVASLPAEFRDLAHEKAVSIQESYRLICSSRQDLK